jgi:hypothetical protein
MMQLDNGMKMSYMELFRLIIGDFRKIQPACSMRMARFKMATAYIIKEMKD